MILLLLIVEGALMGLTIGGIRRVVGRQASLSTPPHAKQVNQQQERRQP